MEFGIDGIIVFGLSVFLVLMRYAWIGYWRMHSGDFIELNPNTGTATFHGNHIIVKTPARTRAGSHLIIVEERVEGSDVEETEVIEVEENGGELEDSVVDDVCVEDDDPPTFASSVGEDLQTQSQEDVS